MFAANDRIPLLNRSADWITWNGLTPEERYFGLAHENDEAVDFNNLLVSWEDYGMFEFGDLVLVDNSDVPYQNSRALYTQITPAVNPNKFHNSMVVDLHTPMQAGVPVMLPVWNYLIDCEVQSTGIKADVFLNELNIYPNPFNEIIHIDGKDENYQLFLFNPQGQILFEGQSDATIESHHLQAGIYFLKVEDSSKSYQKTFKLIKI